MTELVSEALLGPLARDFRTGDRRPVDYLDDLRSRFEAVNPEVEAFLPEPNRWARLEREATALEARTGPSGGPPPLYGVPVGIKDIVDVDGFETKAGSTVPPAVIGGEESPVVTALKSAGALVLGKTVTTEFAYSEPGPTRNPHDLGHTPGGSSSGSAAGVASGLVPLAIGSQTIGSVIRPAAFCGVVGVKPSYGRLSMQGVVPVAPSVDHLGFFTQDVSGAIRAAGVLYPDWVADEDAPPLETVGVVDGPYVEQASEAGRRHFDNHVARMEAAGLDVRRLTVLPDIQSVNRRHEQLVAGEMALSHSDWYPTYRNRYAEGTADLIEDGRGVDVGTLSDAIACRFDLRDQVRTVMDEHDLDLVVSPSAPGPAPMGLDSTGDPVMNLPWSHAGLPTVTIPASQTADGLPIGMQCSTRFGDDERLLRWCGTLESAFGP